MTSVVSARRELLGSLRRGAVQLPRGEIHVSPLISLSTILVEMHPEINPLTGIYERLREETNSGRGKGPRPPWMNGDRGSNGGTLAVHDVERRPDGAAG